MTASRTVSLVTLLLATACASWSEPEVRSSSPNGIVILHGAVGMQAVVDAAERHCAKFGRRAFFVDARGSGVPGNDTANIYRCS